MNKGERKIPQGRVARLTRVARLGTRLGSSLAGAAGRMALGTSREDTAAAFHRSAAEALFKELGKMKGLPMKAGQLLSYTAHLLPEDYRKTYEETLQGLQVKASPMRWSELEKQIERDLGKKPSELFASIEPEPLAAASIGQVYLATLHDGRRVAVKVQYPGIADAIRSDLKNIDLLVRALSVLLPKVDVEQTLKDLGSRLLEECDYGCELCNLEEFERAWREDPEVWVPSAIPELCGEAVLTTEFVEGRSWQEMLGSSSQDERNRYGQALFRFAFRSLYVHGLFNADPHPGNYLFPSDGRVAFIDYGCVQRFGMDTIGEIAAMRRAVMHGETGDALRESVAKLFMLPAELNDEEWWAYSKEFMLAAFEPILKPRFRFDAAYCERLADLALKGGFLGARKALRNGISEPKAPGLVFLSKISVGLYSVLAQLEAEGDWVGLITDVDTELDARPSESV